MIIQNGFIEFIFVEGGGLDSETGHPVKATTEYGEKIPCQYVSATQDLLWKSNGEAAVRQTWTIYIEAFCHYTPSERIRLTDLCEREIGEYSVISFVPLDAVCQYEIKV